MEKQVVTQDIFELTMKGIMEIYPAFEGIDVVMESNTPARRDIDASPLDNEEREMVIIGGYIRLYEGEEDGEITVEILDFSKTMGHGALSLKEKSSFDELPDAVAYAVSHMVRTHLEETLR